MTKAFRTCALVADTKMSSNRLLTTVVMLAPARYGAKHESRFVLHFTTH